MMLMKIMLGMRKIMVTILKMMMMVLVALMLMMTMTMMIAVMARKRLEKYFDIYNVYNTR
jgi:hypothetical protein